MYKILTLEDTVKVSPSKLGPSMRKSVLESLQEQLEGSIDKELGAIVVVFEVESIGDGSILPGDGSIYYPATFKVLVYYPEMYEIVEGSVIDITEFGAFIRIGPLDGLAHISQVMDDFVSYDSKNSTFAGKDSKHVLKEGDKVRARIITVSMNKSDYKIGLTMRQQGLGVAEWIKDAEKKAAKEEKKPVEKEEKKEKKEGKKEDKK